MHVFVQETAELTQDMRMVFWAMSPQDSHTDIVDKLH